MSDTTRDSPPAVIRSRPPRGSVRAGHEITVGQPDVTIYDRDGVAARLRIITTEGDRVQDRPLHEIGGKGSAPSLIRRFHRAASSRAAAAFHSAHLPRV
mgnify:CR=1 FL=1